MHQKKLSTRRSAGNVFMLMGLLGKAGSSSTSSPCSRRLLANLCMPACPTGAHPEAMGDIGITRTMHGSPSHHAANARASPSVSFVPGIRATSIAMRENASACARNPARKTSSGQRCAPGIRRSRASCLTLWSVTVSAHPVYSRASRPIPSTHPQVLTSNHTFPKRSRISENAPKSASKFSRGSPWADAETTPGRTPASREISSTCAAISPAAKSRTCPSRDVAQNVHPIPQPT